MNFITARHIIFALAIGILIQLTTYYGFSTFYKLTPLAEMWPQEVQPIKKEELLKREKINRLEERINYQKLLPANQQNEKQLQDDQAEFDSLWQEVSVLAEKLEPYRDAFFKERNKVQRDRENVYFYIRISIGILFAIAAFLVPYPALSVAFVIGAATTALITSLPSYIKIASHWLFLLSLLGLCFLLFLAIHYESRRSLKNVRFVREFFIIIRNIIFVITITILIELIAFDTFHVFYLRPTVEKSLSSESKLTKEQLESRIRELKLLEERIAYQESLPLSQRNETQLKEDKMKFDSFRIHDESLTKKLIPYTRELSRIQESQAGVFWWYTKILSLVLAFLAYFVASAVLSVALLLSAAILFRLKMFSYAPPIFIAYQWLYFLLVLALIFVIFLTIRYTSQLRED